jgi:hypothetical protein
MRARRWLAALMLVALTSCGDGSGYYVRATFDGSDNSGFHFVVWSGNFNAERILDADSQAFAFFIDNGCLHNFQTGGRNASFCIIEGGNLVQYEGFVIRVANIRSPTGTCVAALVDDATARFIDIDLDGAGREIVFVTALQPVLCTI